MATAVEDGVAVARERSNSDEEQVADNMDEEFDVVDENNVPTGKASRKKCHEEGLLHRSTHIFLFRSHTTVGDQTPSTQVLLQKRSEKKKVGGGQWDVSVAEHLSAGEGYVEATVRGLSEELGVKMSGDSIVAVRQPYLSKQMYQEAGVLDNMFTSTFAALYDERVHGRVRFDEAEVQDAEWWPVERLVREAKLDESRFTRWLLIELGNINVVEVGRRVLGEM